MITSYSSNVVVLHCIWYVVGHEVVLKLWIDWAYYTTIVLYKQSSGLAKLSFSIYKKLGGTVIHSKFVHLWQYVPVVVEFTRV